MKFRYSLLVLITLVFSALTCKLPVASYPDLQELIDDEGNFPDSFVPLRDTAPLYGVFMDAEVGGVAYRTSSGLSGLTDTRGRYRYSAGDTIDFSVGGTNLNQLPVVAAPIITPLNLTGATEVAETDSGSPVANIRANHIVRLLMTLDEDGDPTNGISINAGTRSALELESGALSASLAAETFDSFATQIASVVTAAATVIEAGNSGLSVVLPAPAAAKAHFDLGVITPVLSLADGAVVSDSIVYLSAANANTVFEYSFNAGASWQPYSRTGIQLNGEVGSTLQLQVRGKLDGKVSPVRTADYSIVDLQAVQGLAMRDSADRQMIISWERPRTGSVVISGRNGLGEIVIPNEYTSVKLNLRGLNLQETRIFVRSGEVESESLHFVLLSLPKVNLAGRCDFVYDSAGRVVRQKFYYGDNYLAGLDFKYADDAVVSYNFLPLGLSFGGLINAKLEYTGDYISRVALKIRDMADWYCDLFYNSAKTSLARIDFGELGSADKISLAGVFSSEGDFLSGTASMVSYGADPVEVGVQAVYSSGLLSALKAIDHNGDDAGTIGIEPAISGSLKFTMTYDSGVAEQYFRHDESAAYFEMTSDQNSEQYRSLMYYNDQGLMTGTVSYERANSASAWVTTSESSYQYDVQGREIESVYWYTFSGMDRNWNKTVTEYYPGSIYPSTRTSYRSSDGVSWIKNSESQHSADTGNIVSRKQWNEDPYYLNSTLTYDPAHAGRPLLRQTESRHEDWNNPGSYIINYDRTAWTYGASEVFALSEHSSDNISWLKTIEYTYSAQLPYEYWYEWGPHAFMEKSYFDDGGVARLQTATSRQFDAGYTLVREDIVSYDLAGQPQRTVTKHYEGGWDVARISIDAVLEDYSAYDSEVKAAVDENAWLPESYSFESSYNFDMEIEYGRHSTGQITSVQVSRAGRIIYSASYEIIEDGGWSMSAMVSSTHETVDTADRWKVERNYSYDPVTGMHGVSSSKLYQWSGSAWVLR